MQLHLPLSTLESPLLLHMSQASFLPARISVTRKGHMAIDELDLPQFPMPVGTLEKSPSPYPITPGQRKKDTTLPDKPIPLPSMIHDTRASAEIHCNDIHYPRGPSHLYKLSNMGVPTGTIGLPGIPNSTSVTGQLTGRLPPSPHPSSVRVHSEYSERDRTKSGMDHKEGRNATL